ncbi:MAG: DUF5615 family PIN-like protein [bacterium]
MNLVADESVDKPIVDRLRDEGYDVWYITEMSPSLTDESVLHCANVRQALLLTADKDFGEMVYRQGLIHGGVVLLRLTGLTAITKADIMSKMFAEHASELLEAFSVITPNMIRIRRS